MATKTWAQGTAGNASTGTWSPAGAPSAGDNLVFDGTGTGNCLLDQAITYGTIHINSGYTGTVTQGDAFGGTELHVSAGTFTPIARANEKQINISGNVTYDGGTVTSGEINLKMSGDSTTLNWTSGAWAYYYSLQFSGNVTLSTNIENQGSGGTTVIDSGKTLTINSGKTLINGYWDHGWSNSGTVGGSGTVQFNLYEASQTRILGTINCSVLITAASYASANRSFLLGASASIGGNLTVKSNHSSYTITLAMSGYDLAVTGALTVDVRGYITGGGGALSFGSISRPTGTGTVTGVVFKVAEAITLAESITRTINGASYSFTVTDTIGLADSPVLTKSMKFTDTIGAADSLGAWTRALLSADTISLADTPKLIKALVVSETIALADAAKLVKSLVISDTITASDAAKLIKSLYVSDAIALTESITRTILGGLTEIVVTDSIGVSDAMVMGKSMKLSDAVSLADASLLSKSLKLSESISLADAAKLAKVLVLTENIALSESAKLLKSILVAESITLDDVEKLVKSIAVADGITLTDEATKSSALMVFMHVASIRARMSKGTLDGTKAGASIQGIKHEEDVNG